MASRPLAAVERNHLPGVNSHNDTALQSEDEKCLHRSTVTSVDQALPRRHPGHVDAPPPHHDEPLGPIPAVPALDPLVGRPDDLPNDPLNVESRPASTKTSHSAPKASVTLAPDYTILHDHDEVQGHRILRLKPTARQWQDFASVLAYALTHGVERDGCFKVVIPDDLRDALPEAPMRKRRANAYKVRQLRKSACWQVSPVPSAGEFSCCQDGPGFSRGVDVAFKSLKRLFRSSRDRMMRHVRYRVDVPAWTAQQRLDAGVPARSPIHPLRGDLLDETRAVIPGIHTPYVYESASYFGATFQLHAEDFRLASLNHLYRGRKIWIVLPSTAVEMAERAFGRGAEGCSQFMRHRAEFFFPDRLDHLGVPYRLVDQRPGETIVILPDAYHEGFSTGYTLAEARNYAPAGWSPDDGCYQPCREACRLPTAIPAALMRLRGEGEARLDLCASFLEGGDDDDDDDDDDDEVGGKGNDGGERNAKRVKM